MEARWSHMTSGQKWTLFGGLCVYAVASGYGPLLLGTDRGGWGMATIETVGLALFSAVVLWGVCPSITAWIHGDGEKGEQKPPGAGD